MPTRFKYATVAPSAFALTPAEILLANDKELNAYVSMKKLAPYRKTKEWDQKRAERLKELKAAIAARRWGGQDMRATDTVIEEPVVKKRKGRKERAKLREVVSEAPTSSKGELITSSEEPAKKKRKRNKGGAIAT